MAPDRVRAKSNGQPTNEFCVLYRDGDREWWGHVFKGTSRIALTYVQEAAHAVQASLYRTDSGVRRFVATIYPDGKVVRQA